MKLQRLVLWAALGLTWMGCKKKPGGSGEEAMEKGPFTPPGAASWKVPTEEEAMAFGASVATLLTEGDVAGAMGKFDWEATFERAIAGLPLRLADLPDGFASDVLPELRGPDELLSTLAQDMEGAGAMHAVRTRLVDNERTVLLRFVSNDGALGYLEPIVFKQDDGVVRAVDWHDFGRGQLLSRQRRRLFLILLGQQAKGQYERLASKDPVVRHAADIEKMAIMVENQDFRGAEAVFSRLPDVVKRKPFVLHVWLQAAAQLEEKTYDEAVAFFQKSSPENPGLFLHLIEYHFARKQFDAALKAVDTIERLVDGDPYLDIVRANLLSEAERPKEAHAAAKRVTEKEPGLFDGWSTLFAISVEQGRFKEAAATLAVLESKFQVDVTKLSEASEFTKFLDSKEYRERKGTRSPE